MQVVRMSIFSSAKLYLGSAPGSSYLYSLGKNKKYDYLEEAEETEKDVAMLKEMGIEYVVLLQTLSELNYVEPSLIELYKSAGIKVIHYPVQDMNIPKDPGSFDRLLSTIFSLLRNNKSVLIHCMGGKGRTGLVAAALLIKTGKVNASKAINYVRSIRPGAVETLTQEQFLYKYAQRIADAKTTRRY